MDKDNFNYQCNISLVNQIKNRKIPLIFCTSKSKDETLYYLKQLDLAMPFIVENGGALYLPPEWKSLFKPEDHFNTEDNLLKKEFGEDLIKKQPFLNSLSKKYNLKFFTDMPPAKLSALTGLPLDLAKKAKKRHYDIPFNLSTPDYDKIKKNINVDLNKKKLIIQRGGKYFHITGTFTKAEPVNFILKYYKIQNPKTVSIGLGDSVNDLEMLKLMDIPILIRKKEGYHSLEIKHAVKGIRLSKYPAPEGWNKSLEKILKTGGKNV